MTRSDGVNNKLGSEFPRKFDNYERPILFGRTKRQLVFLLGICIGAGLSVLLYFLHFPKFVTYVLLAVIVTPFILYGTKKDVELKEIFRFKFTIQERVFMTDYQKGESYTKHDFKPKKGVKEVNQG